MADKNEEPLYMRLVRVIAAKEGITAEEVLKRDRIRAQHPEYPTQECITPDIAQGLVDFQQGKNPETPIDWLEVARAHVEGCVYCQLMVLERNL